jgi:hypothetical protein
MESCGGTGFELTNYKRITNGKSAVALHDYCQGTENGRGKGGEHGTRDKTRGEGS